MSTELLVRLSSCSSNWTVFARSDFYNNNVERVGTADSESTFQHHRADEKSR